MRIIYILLIVIFYFLVKDLLLKNINHNPYKLGSLEIQSASISDFFVIDRDCDKISFVAEIMKEGVNEATKKNT